MKKNNVRQDAATGTTTAKEMTKKRVKADKWIYIIQYEYSDGSIEQIIDEYPTKEEAQEAMKYKFDNCQFMNRCFGYENPLAYITDDSARTNSTNGAIVMLWVKKKAGKMSWLKNAKRLDDIKREAAAELAKRLGIEGSSVKFN